MTKALKLNYSKGCVQVAVVGLMAMPWLRILADTCPAPASGNCGTETHSADCPCAPDGGYKNCTPWNASTCDSKQGHDVFSNSWTCQESSDEEKKCLDDASSACWGLYPCTWETETAKCVVDNSGEPVDTADYVAKKTTQCAT